MIAINGNAPPPDKGARAQNTTEAISTSHYTYAENVLRAIHDAGLNFTEITADGAFHRGRGRTNPQWYIANEGETSTGKRWLSLSAGDLRETGGAYVATLTYRSWDADGLTPTERTEIRAAQKTVKAQAKVRISEEQASKAYESMHLWAESAIGGHTYLEYKGLEPHNTRISGNALLIPVYSIDGWFCSLQSIDTEGRKKFYPGAKAAGCYHPINYFFGPQVSKVYIAEGWATAAAIAQVMGVQVVAAFSAGNLAPVAKAIRAEMPDVDIVIAADNDQWTEGNPGLTQAEKAARAVGGKIIVPRFEDTTGKPTDWWDLFRQEGRI